LELSRLTAAILAAVAIGAGTPARAQTTTAPAGSPLRTGVTLAIPDMLERLSREGYSEVSEVERKSEKLYKVSARNTQGRNLEIYVDARTAEVLASEDDKDDE
jgi:Peptidase propeptide and YPEB domain